MAGVVKRQGEGSDEDQSGLCTSMQIKSGYMEYSIRGFSQLVASNIKGNANRGVKVRFLVRVQSANQDVLDTK